MTEKRKLRDLVKQSAPTIVVVLIGILFYMVCVNFPQIQIGIGKFLNAIGPIILGLVFAFIVNIPMSFFERRVFKGIKKPGRRRIISLLCAILIFALLLTAVIALIIPRVITTLTDIINNIIKNYPDYLNKIYGFIDNVAETLDLDISAEDEINSYITGLFDDYKEVLNNIVPFITQAAGNIMNFILNSVLMIVFGIYMLAGKEKYIQYLKTFFIAVLPKRACMFFFNANSKAYSIVRRYVIGTLADCCSLGIMTFIGLMVLKLFFPMDMGLVGLLSVLIGVTQLLPVIGPWIGSAIGGLLLVWYDPRQALWFVIVVIVVQQIDNNVVLPKIVGKMVGISGLLVISAVLVGSKLFGIVGALVCVPLTAVLFAIISDIIARRIEMLNLTDKQRAEILESNRKEADLVADKITKEAAYFIINNNTHKISRSKKSTSTDDKPINPIAIVCTKTKGLLFKKQNKPNNADQPISNISSKSVAHLISKEEANAFKNKGRIFIRNSHKDTENLKAEIKEENNSKPENDN